MTDYQKIIKAELIKRDMTMNDLADEMGITRQRLWQVLSGKEGKAIKERVNAFLGIKE